MKTIIIFLLSFFLVKNSIAQIDTAFWFAAPDVSASHGYDRPIYLRVTAYQQPCVVKIFQPANPAFPVQTLNIPASATQSIDLTQWIDLLECKPGDVVQNFGLKIVSDNRIATYYEANAYGPNPELFALKGRNALGYFFYISSQYILNNSPVLSPLPISSFNIVATEDNTLVTITPAQDIVGHTANITFTVSLNKGQTYAAIATSQLAANHLQGSQVTASKPIAITLADDLLQGIPFGGACEDLAGDQTVPINVLGTEYIAIKGDLGGVLDKLYITAIANGTTVNQDGVFVTTLNAGQSAELTISNPSTYIQTSLPAYVYQLTGVGCEVGSAVLPKITCTGSSSVSVARSSDEPLKITLLVPNGGQNSFLLNNTSGIITAANFSVVPATGGQWYFAKIDLPLSSYPNNTVIKIDNTSKLFQMGFLQGGVLGAAFGYFSDYNALIAEASASSLKPCTGTNVNLYAQTVASATYSWTGPAGFTSLLQNPVLNNVTAANAGKYIVNVTLPGCGTYIDSVTLTILPKIFKTIAISICEGDSYFGHTTSGTYVDTYTGSNTCDSIRTVNLTVKLRTYSTISKIICEGQAYLGYTTTGIYKDTLINSAGCDSVRTLHLTVNAKTFGTINQSICEGQSYLGHTTTGVYKDTIINVNGCDSIRTLNLTVNLKTFGTISQSICEGQSYLGHTTTGVYKDTILNVKGCDSIRTLNLTVNAKTFGTINQSICEGQVYLGHTTTGVYKDTIMNMKGCDSIRTLNLTVKVRTYSIINKIICEGYAFLGYTVTGIYKDTLVNSLGCDSVRTLNLTVNPKTFGTINQVICEGQSYLGHTTTGVYKDTLVNSFGCDSIRTLNLTVNAKTFGTINQSICQGQAYLGHTATGIYKDTILNVNGCDSIRTLNLVVNVKTFGTINQVICEGQAYLGHTKTGVYKDTITNVNGCDSIRTLNLTVKAKTYSIITQKICEGESYLGYIASGVYKDTLKNIQGCDSIRTLNLTVNKKLKSSFAKTICKGETYQGFSVSGIYNIVFTGSNGCDSTEVLTLTVQETPVPNLGSDTAICNGDVITIRPGIYDNYLWQDGSTLGYYKASKPGIYSVVVSNQCGTGSDEILVDEKNCSHTYFPNVFTPNNDNINDYFKILNAYHISEYYLQIFNRWGEKVFETKDYTTGWNGIYHNKPSEGGNYVWYCKFKQEGKQISMKGNVILLR